MRKNAAKKRPTTDWAARIRKLKPGMNALTDAERERLLAEALAKIHGRVSAKAHAHSS